MRSSVLALVVLIGVACSGGGTTTPPAGTDCTSSTAQTTSLALGPVDDPNTSASPGTSSVTLTGTFASTLGGVASGFEIGTGATLAVLDAYSRDAAGRPTAELFVFIRGHATTTKVTFVPVTLAELKNPNFIPPGSFAVYADNYDANAKDYTRWLLPQSGCLLLSTVTSSQVGRVAGTVSMSGTWQSQTGASLGTGNVSATLAAPLLRIKSPTGSLGDTTSAVLTGARNETIATNTVDAFQVLRADQTRLVLVGSIAGDPARELWLSLPGVPAAGDSVTLGAITVEQARAGRAASPFGMLRGIALVGIPPRAELREVWPSSSGWVKFTNVVQTGPLALCGWATGRFSLSATGTDVVSAGQPSLGTLAASGVFATVFTVMAPSDSLVDPVTSALSARVARLAAPHRSSGAPCNF